MGRWLIDMGKWLKNKAKLLNRDEASILRGEEKEQSLQGVRDVQWEDVSEAEDYAAGL